MVQICSGEVLKKKFCRKMKAEIILIFDKSKH